MPPLGDASPSHRERIVERLVAARLRTHGGVLLAGPKAVGKTTTARCFAASEVRLDQDRPALTAAETDPRLVLDGAPPRLIDEYQLARGIWDAVRGRIDDLGGKGLFLLTGSSTPELEGRSHTGARRIAEVPMRTMTLLERGLSNGAVSVGALLGRSGANAQGGGSSGAEDDEGQADAKSARGLDGTLRTRRSRSRRSARRLSGCSAER